MSQLYDQLHYGFVVRVSAVNVQNEIFVAGRYRLARQATFARPDRAVVGDTLEDDLCNVPIPAFARFRG